MITFFPTQLFMVEPIRDYILSAEGAIDEQVDVDEMDDKSEFEVIVMMMMMINFLTTHWNDFNKQIILIN